MGTPWSRPRHRSWASNTNIGGLSCLLVLIIYIVWTVASHGNAPAEIKTLLGIAGGAWFGGITDDRRRRDREVEATANRAEAKVDRLTDVAENEHPGSTSTVEGSDARPGGRNV